MSSESLHPTHVSGRIAAFDGIRGIAYVMIILAHGWTLYPFDRIKGTPLVAWLFVNGSLAVSIFLILGGYFAARSLLYSIEDTTPQLTLAWLGRRVIRVTVAVCVLLAAVLIVTHFEDSPPYTSSQTSNSIVSIVTHTWNWFLVSDPLAARADLGHLWYVSVYVQVLVLFAIVFYVLRRHLTVLAVVLAVAIVAVTLWRAHVVATSIDSALLMTGTRMDGMLWGALLAVLMPHLQAAKSHARAIATAATISIVVLWITGNNENYFRLHGAAFNLAVVALVLGVSHAPAEFRLSRALGWLPFRTIGRRSLSIYVWHYTLFWTITRHTEQWSWPERTVVAMIALTVIVEVVHRNIDEPVKQWLERRLVSRPPAKTVDA